MSSRVWIRRAYDEPTHNDGRRVLIDRIWPRGVSKSDAKIDDWPRDIAPSDELRRWFDHDPDRWGAFRQRYRAELANHHDLIDQFLEWTAHGRVTLVYGAKDQEHNNAVVLREFLDEKRNDRSTRT